MAERTLELRSTGDLFRRSFVSFLVSFPSLLLASLLIFLFRSALLVGAPRLSAISDRFRAINTTTTTSTSVVLVHHNHDAPFADFPVAGNPDAAAAAAAAAGYFSSSDFLFFSTPTSSYNSSFSFSSSSPKPFKVSVPASHSAPFYFSYIDPNAAESDRQDRALDPTIFDEIVLEMLNVLVLVSSFYVVVTLAFVLVFSTALGVVFFAVAASHLRKPVSTVDTFFSGARIGIRRLMAYAYLRWSLTDTLSQSLSLIFSPDFDNPVDLFKFSLKIKFLIFLLSVASSKLFPGGQENVGISGFIYVSTVLDAVGEVIFAVLQWVVVMGRNGRRPGRSAVKEGLSLVSLMPVQAIIVKLLQMVICGRWGRRAAVMIGGKVFGRSIRSLAEVYFMVIWLVFYFAARSKNARLEGRTFGLEDLEECINGIR